MLDKKNCLLHKNEHELKRSFDVFSIPHHTKLKVCGINKDNHASKKKANWISSSTESLVEQGDVDQQGRPEKDSIVNQDPKHRLSIIKARYE